MAITTFKRIEKKFILNESQYQAIIPEIMPRMRFDDNCTDGREYTIHNIYYDTADSSIIRHSLAKPYYKEKLRLRSYCVPTSPNSRVFLELKKKVGGVVSKRRAVLKLGDAYQFLSDRTRPARLGFINAQVLNEIEYFMNCYEVRPTVFISYKRQALFGVNDNDFRITLDRNIITRREQLSLEMGRFGEELLPGRYLLEVKVPGAFPVWLANLLSENEIYKTSFSKYGEEYSRYLKNRQPAFSLRKAG
ncbi:MAG: polyphosphate polymerase domain-containing protein [Syntrophomonadaceae bacterium]